MEDYKESTEYQSSRKSAKLYAVLGIAATGAAIYLAFYLYRAGKVSLAAMVAVIAIIGILRTFFDFNFFSCKPSFIGTLTGGGCQSVQNTPQTPSGG